jgi:hypothetical protein
MRLVVSDALCNEVTPKMALEVSANSRYLQWSDGTPFYIHSDTAWALPRDYSREEVVEYLDRTLDQKFNAVQMSAVFHAVRPDQDLVGPAFHEGDFLRPKEDYWANVDWVVEQTTRRGLVAILNPIWKKQLAAAIRDNGPEKSRAFGRWFAGRYKDNPRVIYFLGGDAVPDPVRKEIIAMGEGIQEVYGGKAIVAYHSASDTTSLDAFRDRPSWLTLNWTYSYCPRYRKTYPCEQHWRTYAEQPAMPFQFGEGYYDFGAARAYGAHHVASRFGNRYAVRRQAWWASFLTGSAGHAYGAEAIWHHNRERETWRMALQYRSRQDMTHKKSFLDQIPWWTLKPDMENEVLVGGYGTWRTDEFAVAAVSESRKLAVVYTPVRHALQLQLNQLAAGKIEARWFDPTSGVFSSPSGWNPESRGLVTVQSPEKNSAGDGDSVLILSVQ